MRKICKRETDVEKKRLFFFIGMLILGAIAMLVYMAFTGNTSQVYTDVVKEYTALHGSNKSAERSLFYIFSFVGAAAYIFYYFKSSKNAVSSGASVDKRQEAPALYLLLGLLVLNAVLYFVYTGVNWLLISGLMLSVILYVVDWSLVIPGTAFLFIYSYVVSAVYRIYVLAGGQNSLSMVTISLISAVSALLFLNMNRENRSTGYLRGILIAQIMIPFTLLIYLASTYQYGEEYIHIHIPYRIQILIIALIAVFVVEAVIRLRKKWAAPNCVGDVISYGVCIAIMSFNRYSGTGSIMSTDFHHPFENIIGYSQIFELGQSAFDEYLPVSGLYSVLHGFFLSFFGHGQTSFYYLTTNLFYLMAIILIVVLLKKQLKGEWVLLIALIFPVIDYDRITFIVPVMLLLAWPRLIERKNLWLKVWFLTSFLHGLYYPVYGAAVCLGFLPLGIWQIVTYIKSGELKKDLKRPAFWFCWILCCIPVGCGMSALIGTAKHMMAMAGQTIYADGLTRFGQVIPDNFFSYIRNMPVRLVVYYIFSFVIVISIVWLSVALCLKTGKVSRKGRKLKVEEPVPACISLSFGIAMLISFSYTVVRMDINAIYARNEGVVYAAFVMIVLIVGRYMKRERNRCAVFAFSLFLIAAVSGEAFLSMEANSKLCAYYTVPENYVHVKDDQVERFGETFVEQATYDFTEYNYMLHANKEESYLGVVGNFGLYYLCGIKGDSTLEIEATIKGLEAAQETVDIIRENDTVVGTNLSSIGNYYLYHWLVTSGEYVWLPEERMFVPNADSIGREDILAQNQWIDSAEDGATLGRTAGSWGLSMDSLRDIFTEVELGYELTPTETGADICFSDAFDGDEADFIYLQFADMDENYQYMLFYLDGGVPQDGEKYWYAKSLLKKDYNPDMVVVISWTDESGAEHSMNCRMDQGKLLIPLGGGRGWLLNEHANISITVKQGEEIIPVPEITDVQLLKLREVE